MTIEVHADGRFEADRTTMAGTVDRTQITLAETEELNEVLTAPDFVALLRKPEAPCSPSTDVFEQMTLVHGGGVIEQNTSRCRLPPIVRARDALRRLTVERIGDFEPGFDSEWFL